jgi:hypothetical protein
LVEGDAGCTEGGEGEIDRLTTLVSDGEAAEAVNQASVRRSATQRCRRSFSLLSMPRQRSAA